MSENPDCPRCKRALEQADYLGLLVFHCMICSGFWVGRAEYLMVLSRKTKGVSRASSTRSSLECPVCSRSMATQLIEGPAIHVDTCGKHGCWFDAGELESLGRDFRQEGPEGGAKEDLAMDTLLDIVINFPNLFV